VGRGGLTMFPPWGGTKVPPLRKKRGKVLRGKKRGDTERLREGASHCVRGARGGFS